MAIEGKYEKEIRMLDLIGNITEIAMFIAGSRASYWYLCTNEKVRAMSEVLFTQRMLTKTTDTRYVNNSVNHLYIVDRAFSVFPEKNVWWETFLHHFASFYRRLRRTSYLLMNTESIPKQKKKEHVYFEDLYEDSIMSLSRPVETLLPVVVLHGALDPGFFIDLPQGQKCHICAAEIGGKKAQLQLEMPENQNIWNVDDSKSKEENMLIRDPKLPIIYEEEYKRGFFVTCGVNPNCNAKAHEFQLEVYKQIAEANLRLLIQSQKCEGCLKFSCATHRCSGCKRIRYCSQECLVDNWKVHKTFCKNQSEKENAEEATIGCRKLEGEEKKVHSDWCVDWLGKCDTIVKLCFSNWHVEGVGIEQLLPKERKKRKKKQKETKQDEKPEEVGANEDKQETETAAAAETEDKCIEEHENLQKVRKIVQQHMKNIMHNKGFEIRHVKSQKRLNEKICYVVDFEPKNAKLLDQRAVCKLKDEGKQVYLKHTNLVDIHATIDDLYGTSCANGHVYMKSSTRLSNTFVNKMLKKIAGWAVGQSYTRPDQLHRLSILKKYLTGDLTEIFCKDFPEYEGLDHNEWSGEEPELFSACLAAVRPGCIGDNLVHFNRFNQLTCECDDERLLKRFREFVVTGMCHSCQAYYIERPDLDNPQCFGSIFVKCSRARSLDGLQLSTA
eukprot:TRINITY_DN16412_c0_g1_i3.p1 TRINITY_DN16412_c0_g1~~TRINITY_DN16412_c0_g1_i3.p1  ORF type:complete len:765 (-),score=146.13 TRINITY_DN16412_c0_g1_i3:103-2106(-)